VPFYAAFALLRHGILDTCTASTMMNVKNSAVCYFGISADGSGNLLAAVLL